MNTAQGNVMDGSKTSATQTTSVNAVSSSSVGKEGEVPLVPNEVIGEVSTEVELAKEVSDVGVEKRGEVIAELPPDIKKLGVTQSGPSVPVTVTQSLPQVSLPLSDNQVLVGLHASITSAIRWLALWCIKKLAHAHLVLKVIHGKIVRVKYD